MQAVRRAGQPAFMPRSANTAGAEASMGIDALCICCSLRKDSTARQGGRGCRLSLPPRPFRQNLWKILLFHGFSATIKLKPQAGQPTPPVRAEESPMGSDAPCLGCCLRKDSPAPKARIACGFNPRRGRGCRLSLPTRRASPQSCAALWAAGGSMGSDAFYNARGSFYWRIPRHRRGRGCRAD